MTDNRIVIEGTIIELKKVADGKVTIIMTEESEIPDISFFSNSYEGKPQFEFLKVGNKYKIEYYEKQTDGKTYMNLLNATPLDSPQGQQTIPTANTYKPDVISKDRIIVRQSSLKVASDILKIKYNVTLPHTGFDEEIYELAEKYEKWVFR